MNLSTIVPGVTPEQAFAAIGDFGNLTAWDPAVKTVTLLDGDPLTPGARYELIGSLLGGGLRLVYEITAIDPPTRVTYVGGTKHVTTTDTIGCRAVDDGVEVTISSELEFRGPTRWYGWAVRIAVALGGRFMSLPALRRHLMRQGVGA